MKKLIKIYKDIEAGGYSKEAGTIIVLIPGDKDIDFAANTDVGNEKKFITSMLAVARYAIREVGKHVTNKEAMQVFLVDTLRAAKDLSDKIAD